jgi:hypothetical protein
MSTALEGNTNATLLAFFACQAAEEGMTYKTPLSFTGVFPSQS